MLIDDIGERSDETTKFYERHCEEFGGVVAVFHVNDYGDSEMIGIFSTLEKATEWADESIGDGSVIFSPYIIDQPEYGNVPVKDMN